MTEKITSAEAHEYIKTKEFVSYPEGVFDRLDIERLLKEAGSVHGFVPPSGKSYLDWARRESVVEAVSRGNYRWTDVESKAVEIGRQIAQESAEEVVTTDTDPNYPQHLTEDEEAFSENGDQALQGIVDRRSAETGPAFTSEEHKEFMDGLVQKSEEKSSPADEEIDLDTVDLGDDFTNMFASLIEDLMESLEQAGRVQDLFHEIEDMVSTTGTVEILIDDAPRLPRKMKKRMKRDLMKGSGATDVTFRFVKVER